MQPNEHEAKGIPFGIASEDPLVPPGGEWWQPMNEAQAGA